MAYEIAFAWHFENWCVPLNVFSISIESNLEPRKLYTNNYYEIDEY